jgi:vancomycin resistance protein VanW
MVISSAHPFSFWKTLGQVTEERGYKYGMELSGGCIVPAIGGGLCLLARALFQAAVYSGLHIIERHGHSMHAVPPPPGIPLGFDATLLYPYVDLRFAPLDGEIHLSTRVKADALIVTVSGSVPQPHRIVIGPIDEREVIEPAGRIRYNQLLRKRFDKNGVLVLSDIVAENRTQMLNPDEQKRSCLTCEETKCHARVLVPA